MIITNTPLKGAVLIEPQLMEDERGFFSRIVCEREFKEYNLLNSWMQQNIAFNHQKGTLRGMHYQKKPFEEIKVVRCTYGAIYDVIVDIRKESSTYKQWYGLELSAQNHKMLYLSKGFAHGYLTLTDKAEISYMLSEFYHPESYAGIRFDDPSINIKWPGEIILISDKDKELPYLT